MQTAIYDNGIDKHEEFGEKFDLEKYSTKIDFSFKSVENILQLNVLELGANHSQNSSI